MWKNIKTVRQKQLKRAYIFFVYISTYSICVTANTCNWFELWETILWILAAHLVLVNTVSCWYTFKCRLCFYLSTPKSALLSNISGGRFISLHGLLCAPRYSICLGLGCFVSKDGNKFHMWGFKPTPPQKHRNVLLDTAKATEHHGTPRLVCNKATSVMRWATGQTFPPNILIQPLDECEKGTLIVFRQHCFGETCTPPSA